MSQEAFMPKVTPFADSLSPNHGGGAEPVVLADHRKSDPPEMTSYTVERDGVKYAGTHILIDLWGASHLTDMDTIDRAFREAIEACGATLLHIHLHEFSGHGGVSGVAVLAESHISVHTWPEYDYAAFDVFMCGTCDPHLAVPVLERFFEPDRVEVTEQMRGRHE